MSFQQPPPGGYGAPAPGPYGAPAPQPAGLADRFVARLIDGILLAVVNFVIIGIVVVGAIVGSGANDGVVFVAGAISTIVSLAISLGYYAYFETTSGQTLGKMVMKLKVVGPGGGPVTLEQSLKRNSFYALSLIGIIPVIGFLGGLAQLAAAIYIAVTINQDTALRQGWHDKFAGETYVSKIG